MFNGCGNLVQGKPAADEEIAEFHIHYNNSNFGLIYHNAHPDFYKNTSLEEFKEFMFAVNHKLGQVTSTNNQGWKVNTYNFVTSAILQQETEFVHGNGTETFTFIIEDEKAELVGYNINSRDLIINETP
jgi:uncharacterized protein YggL (DUF469 family)